MTAKWGNIKGQIDNLFIIPQKSKYILEGDKFRCIIHKGNKVLYYSDVYTIRSEKKTSIDNQQTICTNTNSGTDDLGKKYSISDMDLLNRLDFVRYCSVILKNNGFTEICITYAGKETGIDIFATNNTTRYGILCKQCFKSIGHQSIATAFMGMKQYKCEAAIIMTNNFFTETAINLARKSSIHLWDRIHLDYMIKHPGIVEAEDSPSVKKQETFDWEFEYKRRDAEDRKRRQKEQEDWERAEELRRHKIQQEWEKEELKRRQRVHEEWERQNEQQRERANRENSQHINSSQTNNINFFKGCTTWEQIRERYKKLMLLYHPDISGGDEDYSKTINMQYSELRKKYGK